MARISGRQLPPDSRVPALPDRVVVKLRAAPVMGGLAAQALGGVWNDLAQRYPGVAVRPYFSSHEGLTAATAGGAAAGPLIESERYLAVDVPGGLTANDIARHLRAAAIVETAYPEGGPTPPPVSADDDPRAASQGYLDAAPRGIDARWAWEFADGAGVGFVDLEQGWTLAHEDLAAAAIGLISGENLAYHGHGAAVLGEVASVHNTLGGVGIAPGARTRVVSQWRTRQTYSTADAILSAVAVMRAGDVLLLEAQTTYPTARDHVPVEVEALVFDAITVAVAHGIIVIEAGGNGAIDLDQFTDVHGRQVLNRHSPHFRDSGAILVAAASSRAPHQRLPFSNFGSRIDCYAWGEHIDTAGDGWVGQAVNAYLTDFGGTSGASPIVAGCAVLLQAWRAGTHLPPYSPAGLRAVLADRALNTPSANPALDLIGVMPDLRCIIEQERACGESGMRVRLSADEPLHPAACPPVGPNPIGRS